MKFIFSVFVFLFSIHFISGQEILKDWYHQDPSEGYMGASIDKTYNELLKDKPSKTVIVAILDTGVDINHEDLKDNIWVNPGEIPNNNIDDDKNGYVDDVNGWNFIGGPDGKNVISDTYEVTRLYAKYRYKYENANPLLLNEKDKKEYEQFLIWKKEVEKNRSQAQSIVEESEGVRSVIMAAMDALKEKLDADTLEHTIENITNLNSDDQLVTIGKSVITELTAVIDFNGIDSLKATINSDIDADIEDYKKKLEYGYNPDYDPRSTIVMDDYSNSKESIYGNNDVIGPDPLHGTHIAGIIGAVKDNDIGIDGVASNVKLMVVRMLPDGDERDKDVANAIRYAVDNGASIINMSFGKGYPWDKEIVDEAVKYATKNDVLLLHAAGNSNIDNDVQPSFPHDEYDKPCGFLFWKQKKAKTWIEVGAISYLPGENSVAPFSNYGQENVDLFAPGVKIYSTIPDNEYRYLQGTSMATPVVSGIAAVLRSYFPKLKAEQVKEIIMKSATPLDLQVVKPGDKSGELVDFKTLSVQGGIVNLYNAVKMAQNTKGKKKLKKEKKEENGKKGNA